MAANHSNTTIVRSNYLYPENHHFYEKSLQLWESLEQDLNFNVMFSRRGHLTLAHNDSSLRTMRWRAEVNKLEGVDSEVIGPDEALALMPAAQDPAIRSLMFVLAVSLMGSEDLDASVLLLPMAISTIPATPMALWCTRRSYPINAPIKAEIATEDPDRREELRPDQDEDDQDEGAAVHGSPQR